MEGGKTVEEHPNAAMLLVLSRAEKQTCVQLAVTATVRTTMKHPFVQWHCAAYLQIVGLKNAPLRVK